MQKTLKKMLQTVTLCLLLVLSNSLYVFANDTLYPTDVSYGVQNGYNVINKTYSLAATDDPTIIPKETFSQYGEEYVFSEIVKKEISEDDNKEHIETISINTSTNDLNTILSEFEETIEYNKDGYTGLLRLDINSINTEVSGYSNNSYTSKRTREYPNFSTQDTSLVPKTITDGGLTYNLQTVTFKAGNTDSIDSTQIATSYTAVATYTTNVSSKSVNGYKTTANYVGDISKTVTNKVLYTATFIGNPINEIQNVETDIITEEVSAQTNKGFDFGILLSIIKNLFILALIAAIGYGIYFYLFYRNITIFNQDGLEYKKVGKLHLNTKNPKLVINLNNIPVSKISSSNFVVELSRSMIKVLSEKEIFTIYKELEDSHLVHADVDTNKYQFEANFEKTSFNDYKEESYNYQEEYQDLDSLKDRR